MEFPDMVVEAIEEWKFREYHEFDESQLFTARKIVKFHLQQLGMNEQAIDFFLSCVADPNNPHYYLATAETAPKGNHLRRNKIGNCLFLLKTLPTQQNDKGRELIENIYVCIESK